MRPIYVLGAVAVCLVLIFPVASFDGDSVRNMAELRHGTSPLQEDTDNDGIQDGVELDQYGSDPTDADTDNDGLGDIYERKDDDYNISDPDTDDDSINDYAEFSTAPEG